MSLKEWKVVTSTMPVAAVTCCFADMSYANCGLVTPQQMPSESNLVLCSSVMQQAADIGSAQKLIRWHTWQ